MKFVKLFFNNLENSIENKVTIGCPFLLILKSGRNVKMECFFILLLVDCLKAAVRISLI